MISETQIATIQALSKRYANSFGLVSDEDISQTAIMLLIESGQEDPNCNYWVLKACNLLFNRGLTGKSSSATFPEREPNMEVVSLNFDPMDRGPEDEGFLATEYHDLIARSSEGFDEYWVMVCRFYLDMPFAEIADSLRHSESWVRRVFARACKRMAEELGEDFNA